MNSFSSLGWAKLSNLYPVHTGKPIRLPLFSHTIPAGFPSPAGDAVEAELDLNEYLIKHKAASFYFTVRGDSMQGSGIYDEDKVLVDRSIIPKHGHVVVAVLNNEYTLKRLYHIPPRLELQADNPRFAPITLHELDELQVWGVVTAVVRKLVV